MICPECGRKYEEDFDHCLKCKVLLVEEQPSPTPVPEFIEYEHIPLSFTVLGDLIFLQSFLDGEGITYFIQGERSFKEGPPRLLVKKDQVQQALDIINYMENCTLEADENEED